MQYIPIITLVLVVILLGLVIVLLTRNCLLYTSDAADE